MKQKSLITLIPLTTLIFTIIFPPTVSAKRRLPRARLPAKAGAQRLRAGPPATTRSIKVKFRADRRAITANFTNSANVRKIDYSLTYKTNGKAEGLNGTVDPSLEAVSNRELVFGTASGGVYKYHTGITNARFTVTTTLTNGNRYIKPFRLKI